MLVSEKGPFRVFFTLFLWNKNVWEKFTFSAGNSWILEKSTNLTGSSWKLYLTKIYDFCHCVPENKILDKFRIFY